MNEFEVWVANLALDPSRAEQYLTLGLTAAGGWAGPKLGALAGRWLWRGLRALAAACGHHLDLSELGKVVLSSLEGAVVVGSAVVSDHFEIRPAPHWLDMEVLRGQGSACEVVQPLLSYRDRRRVNRHALALVRRAAARDAERQRRQLLDAVRKGT